MQYDKQGRLTRAGMESVVKSGASFIYNGNIIRSLDDPNFPTSQQLATDSGDTSNIDQLRKENEEKIEALKRENQALKDQAAGKAQTPAPSVIAPVTPAPKK